MSVAVERAYDPLRDSVNFLMERNGRTIICVASRPYLNQHINITVGSPVELLRAFDAHRDQILAAARRKIEAGALERDESIVLRPVDMARGGAVPTRIRRPARRPFLPATAPS